MSILRRVRDITVASLNERLDKAEDPVKLIDRFLASTKEELVKAEQLFRECSTHSIQLKRQWLQAEQQKEQRERQAVTALQSGEEELARAALLDKTTHDERASQYKELYEQSKGTLIELEDRLAELKGEYDEAVSKRSYYTARMESLRLQQRLTQRSSSLHGASPDNMFRQLEERLSDQELEAQSLRKLRQQEVSPGIRLSPEKQPQVDLELAQLKKKLNLE
ncbi:PspA/IM30 family protein [Paenibacillus sp. GCM10012307]|uniref:PspA/IM30 family protein n=1 Tax=Paenibacillus roseus TaxID=2798579 RepID=A0A934IVR9_9BACL|nr:PspA/IM30 family protein [Paenibacillus roseus]MBJ6360197.1 PspA/IM30 family protein [Paenibacillus roseus]